MERKSNSTWLAAVFAGTIFLSAFLLFQVQPLISKTILPWFGGSPAVWTTCMLFFQVLLFGGYLYAHLHEHVFGPKVRYLLHVGLIALALATLPVTPSDIWKPVDGMQPTWRILKLLAVSVGIPYFVLASTGPMIQAWFSRTYAGQSPYRLYALSNFGSLAALVSYPFVVEPLWDVRRQGNYWSYGFVAFGLLCGYAALWMLSRRNNPATDALAPGPTPDPLPQEMASTPDPTSAANGSHASEPDSPGIVRPLLWVALPAIASLMLLATTNHISQDIPPIPFLWVASLSLYLLSFIICFDHPRWYWRRSYAVVTALLALAVAALSHWPLRRLDLNYYQQMGLYFALLFSLCMTCHGELVRLRPHPRYLTWFYLMISAGGALGGIFVSLVAPVIFSSYLEWPIGIAVGFAVAVAVVVLDYRLWTDRVLYAGAVLLAIGMTGLGAIVFLQFRDDQSHLEQVRNFYGELTVNDFQDKENPKARAHVLNHGSIIHGTQFVDPARSKLPTTYYDPKSGVGRALRFFRDRPDLRVGTVGLGTGTIATYARPGHRYWFYEINPLIIDIAHKHFTYLKDCQGMVVIRTGDARLSLESDPSRGFHVLALDAFSGDAIPAHLLTAEAFDVYLKHMDPAGVIAVHVSNRYIDLTRVVHALAGGKIGWQYVWITSDEDKDNDIYGADWMLVTKNERLLEALRPADNNEPIPDDRGVLWTDHYNPPFRILK